MKTPTPLRWGFDALQRKDMGLAVYVARIFQYPNDWVRLIAQITINIAINMLLCRLFELQAFMEIWQRRRNALSRQSGGCGDRALSSVIRVGDSEQRNGTFIGILSGLHRAGTG